MQAHTHSRIKNHDAAAAVEAEAEHAIETLRDKAAHLQERIKAGVHNTEGAIKEHPWAAVGIAAGVGVGVGLLIGMLRRRE
ncbi:MAG TPA: hypothetical protein VK737_13005 [Opitutales bacterium]|jgi:ElaB/YqjD/DUF883 family membrane-anchored ribosome-binding protein|nr:hypothetical protein [Opitutales bacterium]